MSRFMLNGRFTSRPTPSKRADHQAGGSSGLATAPRVHWGYFFGRTPYGYRFRESRSGLRLLSKVGQAGSALWIVQLASSRHSVRVVNCLVIEAPFDDGAHSGIRHASAGNTRRKARVFSSTWL